jgi:hypothetical protein
MKYRGRMTQWGLAAAAVAMVLAPAGARADVTKCQKGIEVAVSGLQKAINTGLVGCQDAIRTEVAKGVLLGITDCNTGGGCPANAAKICEAKLAPVYDAAGAKPGKSAVAKFRAAIAKLRVSGKCVNGGASCTANATCPPSPPVVGKEPCSATCTDEDLPATLTQDGTALGHLVSGIGGFAPPASGDAATFLTDFLLFAVESVTIKQQLASVPDMLALFQDAVSAKASPPNTSGVSAKKGTSCSPAFNSSTEAYYPNLCHFGVQCHEHSCQVDTTGNCPIDSSTCDAGDSSGTCPDSSPCHFDNPLACGGHPSNCSPNVCSGACTPTNSYLQIAQPPPGLNLPVALAGGLNMEICSPGPAQGVCKTGGAPCHNDLDCGANKPCSLSPGAGEGFGFGAAPNFLYLINAPSKTVRAVIPNIFSSLIAAACVGIVRSEGWCDCTGQGVKKDFTLCSDNVLTLCAKHCTGGGHQACSSNADCSGAGTCGASKTCHDGVTACSQDSTCPAATGNDACGVAIDPANPNDNKTYPGTLDGGTALAAGGASTAGDCVDLVSASFSFMTDASQLGPDGLPCTADDFAAPSAPFALPLTTGTATAELLDAPTAGGCVKSGHCSGGVKGPCTIGGPACSGTSSGTCTKDACVQDVNCITGDPLDLCKNPAPAFTALKLTVTGGKTSCAEYQASNLSGFAITGAVAADAGAPIGSVAVGFRFACK